MSYIPRRFAVSQGPRQSRLGQRRGLLRRQPVSFLQRGRLSGGTLLRAHLNRAFLAGGSPARVPFAGLPVWRGHVAEPRPLFWTGLTWTVPTWTGPTWTVPTVSQPEVVE